MEQSVANTVQNALRRELRSLGFDAFDTRATFDSILRSGPVDADFYVEVVSADAAGRPLGGIGVGSGDLAVEVGVLVARVAAEVRLYDARTLKLVERYELQKKSTAVVPTGIGIGGRSIWASIFIPFAHYGQYRAAARDVAHQAAIRIAGQ